MGRGVARAGFDGVALLFISAFVLILLAAVLLAAGLVSDDGLRSSVVALVAGVGGLLLLWLGVVSRSGSTPSAG